MSGVAPADDVMIEVDPGQEFQYTYNIPDEHLPGKTNRLPPHRWKTCGFCAPISPPGQRTGLRRQRAPPAGTHWYHPHHHGSTSLQAGCGAAGVLVVEDTPAVGLPQAVADMEEVVMMIQDLDVDRCRGVSTSMNPSGNVRPRAARCFPRPGQGSQLPHTARHPRPAALNPNRQQLISTAMCVLCCTCIC